MWSTLMKARISHPLSVFSIGAAFAFGTAIASAEPALETTPAAHVHESGEGGHAAHHAGELDKIRSALRELAAHADERIAALKTELKITDAQLPQWNGFAEALRSAAKSVETVRPYAAAQPGPAKPARVYGGERSYPDAAAIKKTGDAPSDDEAAKSDATQAGASGGLPARLEDHEKRIAEHLANLKAIKTALDPLYASFSDEQKKLADGLTVGPFGVL